MQNADRKHRFAVVHPLEALRPASLSPPARQTADRKPGLAVVHPRDAPRPGTLFVPRAAPPPSQPQNAVDGDCQPALDAPMLVSMHVLAQNSRHHPDTSTIRVNPISRSVQWSSPCGSPMCNCRTATPSAATVNAWPSAYVMPKRNPLFQLRCTAVISEMAAR